MYVGPRVPSSVSVVSVYASKEVRAELSEVLVQWEHVVRQ